VRLLDELKAEHDLIEKMLGSLQTFVDLRVRGEGDPADAPAFLAFFRLYAAGYHHAREEDVLFPALVKEAELPEAKGPVPALIAQHQAMAAMLGEVAPLLGAQLAGEGERARLVECATRYTRALWAHIDAENSVMLPESEKRLRRVGVLELDGRGPTVEEAAARDAGERLVLRYPPANDHAAVRGEGCVVCPSYGVDCDGVEREWWNESEWEEFPDHL
jgi:hemerythrin-like domain-containing protein